MIPLLRLPPPVLSKSLPQPAIPVYAISATGLTSGSLFISVGNQFGSVDPATGVVTPILTGAGLHGADFVASPEPASIGMALAGFGMLAFGAYRRRAG